MDMNMQTDISRRGFLYLIAMAAMTGCSMQSYRKHISGTGQEVLDKYLLALKERPPKVFESKRQIKYMRRHPNINKGQYVPLKEGSWFEPEHPGVKEAVNKALRSEDYSGDIPLILRNYVNKILQGHITPPRQHYYKNEIYTPFPHDTIREHFFAQCIGVTVALSSMLVAAGFRDFIEVTGTFDNGKVRWGHTYHIIDPMGKCELLDATWPPYELTSLPRVAGTGSYITRQFRLYYPTDVIYFDHKGISKTEHWNLR
jgi:hypothetical protein